VLKTERGRFPLFFFGEKMLINFMWFIIGMAIMWCLNYFMGQGRSALLLHQTQKDCAILFTSCHQGLEEVYELKYLAMREAERSEHNLAAQQHIDKININNIKKVIMRNYVTQFPNSYRHVLEYNTWEELEDYVNKLVQTNKEA
tara:strand:+ start:601 stop:1032 length:432 start_codon:yes stop_codon:yes gene_type:complete